MAKIRKPLIGRPPESALGAKKLVAARLSPEAVRKLQSAFPNVSAGVQQIVERWARRQR